MNILVLPPSHGSYNSLRPEFEIYRSLAQAGHAITIILKSDCIYLPYLDDPMIKVIIFDIKHKISITAIRLIRSTIASNNIQLVYASHSRKISNAVLACIGLDVKLVIYRGTTGGLHRTDPSAYLNALNPRVNAVICVSKTVKQSVGRKVFRKFRQQLVMIYKGHDISWYQNTPVNLEQFNSNSQSFNVACVLNVRPHKGLKYLLEAAAELSDLKDLHIILIGKNTDKQIYTKLINKSGMRERIHITGYRYDAPEIIASCDILVSASYRKEGLPRVLMESLSYRVPVIATSLSCSMEVIEDGINGYIVPTRDSHAIAEKIRYLYNNPDLLKKLSDHCQQTITENFSHQVTVKKYIELFQQLVDQATSD